MVKTVNLMLCVFCHSKNLGGGGGEGCGHSWRLGPASALEKLGSCPLIRAVVPRPGGSRAAPGKFTFRFMALPSRS